VVSDCNKELFSSPPNLFPFVLFPKPSDFLTLSPSIAGIHDQNYRFKKTTIHTTLIRRGLPHKKCGKENGFLLHGKARVKCLATKKIG
jgi:hypothetical protein